jgi:CRP/FNR family transcriptional regulator
MGQFCLPHALTNEELDRVDDLVKNRTKLKKNDRLYQHGEKMSAIYNIRFGSLKSQYSTEDGQWQVVGFHLPGDMVGLDSLDKNIHQTTAIAMEDSEACIIKLDEFESLSYQIPSIAKHLQRNLSREIGKAYQHALSLGHDKAQEKLAYFILDLSDRKSFRGSNGLEFELKMGREEIASFLGMEVETVSRILTKLMKAQLIEVSYRHIKIININGLRTLSP